MRPVLEQIARRKAARERAKIRLIDFNNTHPNYIRWYRLKKKSEKRGFGFDLDEQIIEALYKGPCFYCGRIVDDVKMSVDRINNDLGYLKTNVVSACILCNAMKRTLRREDFLAHCTYISLRWIERCNPEWLTNKAIGDVK